MHKTPSSTAGHSHNAGWLARSHVFYPTTELHTAERHLLLKCLETLLYAEQKCLGMLNPFAAEYYPQTETNNIGERFENLEQLNKIHDKQRTRE